MTLRTVTKFICISVAIFLIGYDLIPFFAPERGDTISEIVAKWGLKCFTLPLVFGALMGHFFFFWNGHKPVPTALFAILISSILIDVIARVFDVSFLISAQTHPFVPFLIGLPIGHFLWPQSKSV